MISIVRSWRLLAVAAVLVGGIGRAQDTNDFRAARSVHLGYSAPEGLAFYTEMAVEKSVNGSYFMACGWNTGYFGIQQINSAEEKVAIFSVWDPTTGDDPNRVKSEDRVEVLYEGEGVRIKRFGGEGTGGQCMWDFPWVLGQTNRFLIAAELQDTRTAYTAWLGVTNGWKKLATFRTHTKGRPLGGYYSFVEDFRRDYRSALDVHRARYGNGWVKTMKNEWMPLRQARFTASGAEWEAKDTIDAGVASDWFYLATGGETKMSRELRSMIELPGKAPASENFISSLPAEVVKK